MGVTEEGASDGAGSSRGDGVLADGNWRSTRTSVAVVGLVTGGLGWVLATRVEAIGLVGLGTVGVLVLAGSFWLYSVDRWQIPARLLGNLVVLLGAGLIVLALGLLGAREFAERFPQPTVGQIPQPALEVASHLLVVAALLMAVLGVVATIRPVLTRRVVRTAFVEQGRMAAFLVILAGLAEVRHLQTTPRSQRLLGLEETVDVRPLEGVREVLLVPEPEPNLFPVLFLLVAFLLALRLTIAILPLSELRASIADGTEDSFPFDPARTLLSLVHWTIFVGGILGFFGLLVSLDQPSDLAFYADAAPGLVTAARPIAASAGLRAFLANGAIALGLLYVAVWVFKKLARTESAAVVHRWTGFITGALLALLAVLLGPTTEFFGLVEAVAGAQSGGGSALGELLREVIVLLGPLPLLLWMLAAVVGLALLLTAILGTALLFRYLPEDQAGPSLASGGLFLATAFATTLGLPLSLAVVGLVGSMLVWDAGEFGSTLGREIGRAGYRSRVEIVHVAGTLAVGVLAAALALSVEGLTAGFVTPDLAVLPLAIVGSTAGILLLVIALR